MSREVIVDICWLKFQEENFKISSLMEFIVGSSSLEGWNNKRFHVRIKSAERMKLLKDQEKIPTKRAKPEKHEFGRAKRYYHRRRDKCEKPRTHTSEGYANTRFEDGYICIYIHTKMRMVRSYIRVK